MLSRPGGPDRYGPAEEENLLTVFEQLCAKLGADPFPQGSYVQQLEGDDIADTDATKGGLTAPTADTPPQQMPGAPGRAGTGD